MRLLFPILAVVALVTACASQPGAAGGAGSSSSAPPDNALVVEIHRGGSAPAETYMLTCGTTVTGNHPDGGAACAHLATLKNPFAPIPGDMMCNQIYGGPQTAHVTGRWNGKTVDLKLSRTDGCRVEQWASLGPLLPGPVGAAPPS